MSTARLRRIIGLLAGGLLACLGALGMWISKAPYDNPLVHRFCESWFCPDEFTPERIFQLSQKAALGDAPGQLREFQRALVMNSASAYRWADLGDSEFNARDLPKARYAYDRSLAAAPRSPIIALRAANFFFASGDFVGIFQQLGKILNNPELSSYYETVFFTYSRLGLPLNVVLHQGVPAHSAAAAPFLKFWIKLGREPEVNETWQWLNSRGPVDSSTASAYTAFLLGLHRDALAQQTWQTYVSRQMPTYGKTNWVYNGDFAGSFTGSPFDWIVSPVDGVEVNRFKEPSRSGNWALQFTFAAQNNLDYRQTYESVFLTPGEWRFSAKVKTQGITTDQGPRFHLSDFDHPVNLDVWTEPEIGTQPWHEVSSLLHIKPGTGTIRIEVIRTPSNHLDYKISGTASISELALTPAK